jgi:hypothetical protein
MFIVPSALAVFIAPLRARHFAPKGAGPFQTWIYKHSAPNGANAT